jgi:hypothetical protein
MNAQENNEIKELREDVRILFRKLDAVMEEQQRGANSRGEIKETLSDIVREQRSLKKDVDDMKPTIARGKRMFLLFIGGIFGAGFSFAELKTWIIKFLALAPCLLLACVVKTEAHDGNPEHDAWFKSLRSDAGNYCCDGADAWRVNDPDWDTFGKVTEVFSGYRVRLDSKGAWIEVPKAALISPDRQSNRIGIALVWPYDDGQGKPLIRCFMPGTTS